MIANFLLSPPGLLTINNIESYFPLWLCDIYASHYQNPATPVASTILESYTNTDSSQSSTSIPQQDIEDLKPDFGPVPSSIHDLLKNRVHLNRLLGLSNLYYIDPEDDDIRDELLDVRRALASLIIATPETELEKVWSGEFGDRFWARKVWNSIC